MRPRRGATRQLATFEVVAAPLILSVLALMAALLLSDAAVAQITLDGTLGPKAALQGPNYLVPADVGQQVGGNLFHSFGAFNVHTGESATFTGPDSVENVIGRVTGGNASVIDGRLSSEIPHANLYLINPSGVMFGPHATVDVQGSFAVTTADYVRLGDGGRFDAVDPGKSVLTSAPPAAFGFLGNDAARIAIAGSDLHVGEGATLSVVGGDVEMQGGSLTASGGRINLVAASTGEVSATEPVPATGLERTVTLEAGARVDVGGEIGGSVVVRSGSLQLSDARIDAVTQGARNGGPIDISVGTLVLDHGDIFTDGRGAGRGGAVAIQAHDAIRIASDENGGEVKGIYATSHGSGGSGQISIATPELDMEAANIESDTYGSGAAGDVLLQMDHLRMGAGAGIVSAGQPASSGPGGNVTIMATRDICAAGAGIVSLANDRGDAGVIMIFTPSLTLIDGALLSTATYGEGRAGNVVLQIDYLRLINVGQIQSSAYGAGQGGSVTIIATAAVMLSQGNESALPSVITSSTSGGDAGTVSIRTPLLVLEGGRIDAPTSGGAGHGGDLVIRADRVVLSDGAVIDSSAQGVGQGGAVDVQASESISVSGRGSDGSPSRISSTAVSTGNGGQVMLSARLVTLDDAIVSTGTFGSGNAGEIAVQAGSLQLSGGAVIDSGTRQRGAGGTVRIDAGDVMLSGQGSALTSNAGDRATGEAGSIEVQANRITLADGAAIAARSTGTADAGAVRLNAAGDVQLSNAAVTTEAAQAQGGNIDITGRDLRLEHASAVSASVAAGEGGGGNLHLDGSTIVTLDDSDITANAHGGPGGNIVLRAQTFFHSPDSDVTASSDFSQQGTVTINAPETNLAGVLEHLQESFLRGDVLQTQRCAARGGERSSSLVIAGRDGLPLAPDAAAPTQERALHVCP